MCPPARAAGGPRAAFESDPPLGDEVRASGQRRGSLTEGGLDLPRRDPLEQFDMDEARKEAKILSKLRLKSFTATPKTIRPFEESTLKWDVFVPPDVEAEADFSPAFSVAGEAALDRTGMKIVSPLGTASFVLKAHGERSSRVLGSALVVVNADSCQQFEIRTLQLKPQAEALRERFLTGSLSARGEVKLATITGGLAVTVPLKIDIPNFFDADANVVLKLDLSARAGRGVIKLLDVDVDIIFHLAEHILSLGSATAAQALLQPLAADLIKAFLGAQLEGDISQDINAVIAEALKFWQNADPNKRKFKLFALTTTNVGVTITGCPL